MVAYAEDATEPPATVVAIPTCSSEKMPPFHCNLFLNGVKSECVAYMDLPLLGGRLQKRVAIMISLGE